MLYMNVLNDLDTIYKRIAAIQCQLAQLGPMRPGCLSRQYRNPKLKKGPYFDFVKINLAVFRRLCQLCFGLTIQRNIFQTQE